MSSRPTFRFYIRSLSFFKEDWWLIAIFFFQTAISTGIGLLQSWPMAVLIDAVLTPTPRTDFMHRLFLYPLPKSQLGQVIGICVISMIMKVVQDLFIVAHAMMNNYINNRGVMRARNAMRGKLYHLDQNDAMYRVCSDVTGFCFILATIFSGLISLCTLVFMLTVLMVKSIPLTLMGLAFVPAFWALNKVFRERIRKQTVEAKETDAKMIGLIHAPAVIFEACSRDVVRSWIKLNWRQEWYAFLVRMVFTLAGGLVFGYGGYLVWRDQFAHPIANGMTLGTLAVFMDYLAKLLDPLSRICAMTADLQPGVAGAQRVFEVLDRQ
jgi:ABC-type multidrug transport system fused ATPase/permease subunit